MTKLYTVSVEVSISAFDEYGSYGSMARHLGVEHWDEKSARSKARDIEDLIKTHVIPYTGGSVYAKLEEV